MKEDKTYMPDLFKVLFEVVEKLEEIGIRYMLTGSVAGYIWGVRRFTNDIDIVVELKNMKAEPILKIFSDDEYYVAETALKNTLFGKEKMFNVISERDAIKADLIALQCSEYREFQFSRRKKVTFSNQNIFVISPEDLVISKLIWIEKTPSELQQNDILAILNFPELDLDYINKWSHKLQIEEIWQDILTHHRKQRNA